jgi:hypothetical protein
MYRATFLIALVATSAWAANGPPLASAWNVAATGNAASSGDLAFRVTRGDGSDPVDITVPVISGASQDSVARSIGRALSSQLRHDHYSVQLGENGNVLVSDPRGQPNFSLELVDSSIDNVRVAVQSVTPAAPPTVPTQALPAEAPATTPANNTPAPANTPPAAPPPANSPAMPNGTPPPSNSPPMPNGAPPPANSPPVPNGSPPPANSPPMPNPSPPPGNSPSMPNASPPPGNGGSAGSPASAPPPR